MKKVLPLEDRVLVKIVKEEEKTPSGIILPDVAKEKPQIAEVIEVGDDETIKVKKGDKIIFAKYSGTEIKIDGEDYLILSKADILAKIEE
ncbi:MULTISPECIES: co-chaperone GroES [Dictyoglomus]|jgi:chaperonin GroES|uniref:Co-chaperonin GroES n=1 Tax=Dictyoglomus turgidum (strain DSM 6724 / Z-1310) TaxID=515635 RepID=B8DYI9_DICTD|nr:MULTISPECIES: co-chaperone GroES [Dictyoglomus]ACK41371.1 chaperonin Cpn10 [Dictyoglomus turgidum DSM 6724]PNV80958.1 MAG: co-chaperone GroES [Dictyoglomus turgidum]HBU31624.1 co-chaperone GroES [Dictyoglomus sp.]